MPERSAGQHRARLRLGDITLEGVSTAGMATSLRVPELGVLFDVGLCPPSHSAASTLLVTHGHPDHCGAFSAWLGLRALARLPPARVYADASIAGELEQVRALAERMAQYPMEAEIIAAHPGERLSLPRRDLFAVPFRSVHRVPTLGWSVVEQRRKLRAELEGLPGEEIARRRKAGERVHDEQDVTRVTYPGDTRVDVLRRHPWVMRSQVLLMEATFLDDWKGVEVARRGGHTHLDELVEIAPELEVEHLVVVHLSQRYRPEVAARVVLDRLGPHVRGEVHAFTTARPARGARR